MMSTGLLVRSTRAAERVERLSAELSALASQFIYQESALTILSLKTAVLCGPDPLRIFLFAYPQGFARNTLTGISLCGSGGTLATTAIDFGAHPIQNGMMYRDFAVFMQQGFTVQNPTGSTQVITLVTLRAQQ